MERVLGFLIGFVLAGVIGWLLSLAVKKGHELELPLQVQILADEGCILRLRLVLLLITFIISVSTIVVVLLHEWLLASIFGILSAALIGFQLQFIRYTFKKVTVLYSRNRRASVTNYGLGEETTEELEFKKDTVEEVAKEEEQKKPESTNVRIDASERDERANEVRTLIGNNLRRLQKLKERKALLGIATPVHDLIEIEDIEKEIKKLKAELADLEAKS